MTKRIEVEEAHSIFARRLKLSFFFRVKKLRTRDQKFRPKSNFIPPGPTNPVVNKDIIIKPADKGVVIVVMDKTDYVGEAERQLANQFHYKRLEEPVFPKSIPKINDFF